MFLSIKYNIELLSGKCNCLSENGICRCKSDDKCKYDKCGICNGNGDCNKKEEITELNRYCEDKNLIIEEEICHNIIKDNPYDQHLKNPIIVYNGGLKTEIIELNKCDPLKLEILRKCCQKIKFSTINREFKYQEINNYKYYLNTKFDNNKEIIFNGEFIDNNGICKDKEEIEIKNFEKKTSKYYLSVSSYLDEQLTIPLTLLTEKEEKVYFLITLYKNFINGTISKKNLCTDTENEDVSLNLKNVNLNIGYIDFNYQVKQL